MTDLTPITSSYGADQLARIDHAIKMQPGVKATRQERAKYVHDLVLAHTPKLPSAPSEPAGDPMPPDAVPGPWRLLWNEDFTGDLAAWNVQDRSTFGDGNNEAQTYMAANVEVRDGTLRLKAKSDLTSGMVTTRKQGGPQRFKYRHGYCEARIRCPLGSIYWPAFWMVGAEGTGPWPAYGEFDVCEVYGPRPLAAESNYHRPGGNIGGRAHPVLFGVGEWHTYGLLWDASSLTWVYDGQVVRTHRPTSETALAPLQLEHSFILNLALGGNGPAGYGWEEGDLSGLPGIMEVDYVRVWQRP